MSKTSRDKRAGLKGQADGKLIKSDSDDRSDDADNVRAGYGGSRDAIDAIVRARYIEYLANSGIAQGRLHLEALFWMPTGFVRMYERLYERAFKETVVGGQAGAKEKGELGRRGIEGKYKGTSKGLGSAGGVGKRYKDHWIIKDEEAMRLKGLVDRKLERLVVEIGEEMNLAKDEGMGGMGGMGGSKRCKGGCGRFLKEGWKYCPYDGTQVPVSNER